MISMSFLKTVELVAGLDDEHLSQLQRSCGEVASFDEGTRVFAEGTTAESLYVVMEGHVALRFDLPGRETSPTHTLQVIAPGGVLGWSAVVPPYRYSLSAYVVDGSCQLLRFRRGEFLATLERDPAIGYEVMRNLTHLIAERFFALEHKFAQVVGEDEIHGW